MRIFNEVDKSAIGDAFPLSVYAVPALLNRIEKLEGCIVNISSMAAQQTITRVCGYSASKAAIDNFTKWLAVEMATKLGDKIRVNAIAPGFFLAEQNRALLTNEDGSLTSRGASIRSSCCCGP